MSAATLALGLAVAFGLIAVTLNHCYARLAIIELTFNEGLPPGYERNQTSRGSAVPSQQVSEHLGEGLHVFLSRSCHACQRLIQELDQSTLEVAAPLHLRYVDRPRPIASSAAMRNGAELHTHDVARSQAVDADPLPYAIAVGDHDLLSRGVVPSLADLLTIARDAGIAAKHTSHHDV